MAARRLKSGLILVLLGSFSIMCYLQFVYTNSVMFSLAYANAPRRWSVGTGIQKHTQLTNDTNPTTDTPVDNHVEEDGDENQNIKTTNNKINQSDIKTILLWTPKYGNTDFGMGLGQSGFVQKGCMENRCSITSDKTKAAETDAILYHAFDTTVDMMPARLSQDQIWIFYNLESPLSVRDRIRGTNDMYNLTITYMHHPDTDIVTRIRKLKSPATDLTPSECVEHKTRLVMWAVSNCDGAASQRMEYAKQLAEHVPVDVYGRCGNLTCSTDDKAACYAMFERKYYFHLSFENSVCDQYVTEKVYAVLRRNIVPVILGGGDYGNMFPPGSYLDVRDFRSPRHLADHMRYLSNNKTAYLEHFAWRVDVERHIRRYEDAWPSYGKTGAFCRLCEVLHNSSYQYKSEFDVEEYWSADKLCVSGKDERQVLHMS